MSIHLRNREVAYIAGPPFIGVLPHLRRNPLKFFTSMLNQHGDRVQFSVLGRKVLLLCHPDDLEQVLVKDREVYGRSTEIRSLRPIFGDGLLASEGALWRRQRSMTQPSFQHDAMTCYATVMLECIQRQIAQWNHAGICSGIYDIHAEMMQYTRETICRVLFGAESEVNNAEIAGAVSVVFGDLRTEILYLRLWRWLPFGRNRRWNQAVKLLNRSIQRAIEARRAAVQMSDDLLGALLKATDSEGNHMSDRQLRDEVLTFFLAGHETAALALTWSAYLVAKHPSVQELILDELQNISGLDGLRAEHYPKLRYLTAVVKEALRLYPPVWSLGRQAVKHGSLGAHTVENGTEVWLCIHQLHRDGRWYSNPDEFQPDRWLHDRAAEPYTYLPFGIGPRVCIGQHFAVAETVLGLGALIGAFRLSLVSENPAEVNPWITLRPKQVIHLRLSRR